MTFYPAQQMADAFDDKTWNMNFNKRIRGKGIWLFKEKV